MKTRVRERKRGGFHVFISASSAQTHLSCAVLRAELRSMFRGWYLLNRQNDANVSCSFTCSPVGSLGRSDLGTSEECLLSEEDLRLLERRLSLGSLVDFVLDKPW